MWKYLSHSELSICEFEWKIQLDYVRICTINISTTCKINSITLRRDNHLIHLDSAFLTYWNGSSCNLRFHWLNDDGSETSTITQQREILNNRKTWFYQIQISLITRAPLLISEFNIIIKQRTQQVVQFVIENSKIFPTFIR